ncbi:hypothetical protein GCM10008957_46690 [Deinococcus ruber]|uniref:Uncharacterized protein n=1 Tax=Deinococcus ruber TaxID=1848197 RepID=A0A918CNF3_9DEIO|nr:hypothetical protein GCM10008957_46690 [Deinococcus ruber]
MLYALLAHLYLEQPRPEIAVLQRVQDIRTVQQHTRVRLRAQPPQLALSPGHEDRSLKLTLDAPTQLRFPPPPGGSKISDGSYVTYGLSHVDTLLTWAEQTHTRVCFTPDDLQAFRSKPGGTLEVMLDAQHAVLPVRLRAGPDPDRQTALRPFLQGRLQATVPQFLLPDLHTVVTMVLHYPLASAFRSPRPRPTAL